jgi:hypothetical protein
MGERGESCQLSAGKSPLIFMVKSNVWHVIYKILPNTSTLILKFRALLAHLYHYYHNFLHLLPITVPLSTSLSKHDLSQYIIENSRQIFLIFLSLYFYFMTAPVFLSSFLTIRKGFLEILPSLPFCSLCSNSHSTLLYVFNISHDGVFL